MVAPSTESSPVNASVVSSSVAASVASVVASVVSAAVVASVVATVVSSFLSDLSSPPQAASDIIIRVPRKHASPLFFIINTPFLKII